MPRHSSKRRRDDEDQELITTPEMQLEGVTNESTNRPTKHKNNGQMSLQPEEEQQFSGNISAQELKITDADRLSIFVSNLLAKNKISAKNAFEMPMVKLKETHDFKKMEGDNSWRRVAATIDGNNRIYGYRVDAAHSSVYRMLERVANGEKKQQVTRVRRERYQNVSLNTEFFEGNQDDLYTQFIQKQQKNINVCYFKGFFSVDPILERTKRVFDQQGLKGLFLDNIVLQNDLALRIVDDKDGMKTEKKEIDDLEWQSQDGLEVPSGLFFESLTKLCVQIERLQSGGQLVKQEDCDELNQLWQEMEELAVIPQKKSGIYLSKDSIKVKQNNEEKDESNYSERSHESEAIKIVIRDQLGNMIIQDDGQSATTENHNNINEGQNAIEGTTLHSELLNNQEQENQHYFGTEQRQTLATRQVQINSYITFKFIRMKNQLTQLKELNVIQDHHADKQTASQQWQNPQKIVKAKPKPRKKRDLILDYIDFQHEKQKGGLRSERAQTLLVDRRTKSAVKGLLKSLNSSELIEKNRFNDVKGTHKFNCLSWLRQTQQVKESSIRNNQGSWWGNAQPSMVINLQLTCDNFSFGRSGIIKGLKDKIMGFVIEDELTSFISIYSRCVSEEGPLSPALCFLSLLHFCNQNVWELTQNNEWDITVNVNK